ncbi:MAG: hypothetical protein WBQ09_11390 [Terriglobales bacterium]|jgi:hypothetical protein
MFVRCEDCNYENLAQHSFCGMCGAKLPSPQRVARSTATEPEPLAVPPAFEPERAAPQPVTSGPSLLGLGAGPTEPERGHYLLEEEPGSSHWRGWVAVLILAAAVGGSGWHWRTEIRGWIGQAPQNLPADAGATPSAATATPETAAPSTITTAPGVTAPPTPVENPAASTSAATTAAPTAQTTAPPTQAVTDAVARTPEAKDEKPPDATANPIATQPTATAVAPQPVTRKIERKAPTPDESTDALEARGENYLYGHGVPADCGRAGKSLLAAAARSSAKAQSVLGAMYATGHCVTRDVPTAYRWFAKALHQDPGNVRIQRDLEVLWAQMTQEEREVAMKAGP